MRNTPAVRRAPILLIVLLLAIAILPVDQVVANEVAPETRSATVEGLPAAVAESPQDREDGTGAEAAPSAPARQLSEVVEAPLPFSGLGFVSTGEAAPELHWRALTTDGEWSEWHPVPFLEEYDGPDPDTEEARASAQDAWISDAVWVGEATHLQVDARGVDLDDVEVTFIDSAGLSESLPERVLRHLRSLGTEPPPADASVTQPNIISRAQWGADESCTSGTISYATPHFTVIHHTATTNDYTEDEAAQQVRNIYHWHTACHGSGNNWWDIGYNFLIDRFGNIYEGRRGGIDKGVIGAHAGGWNTGSIGVGLMGNHNTAVPTSVSLSALNDLLHWKFYVHDIPTSATSTTVANDQTIPRMVGHRNVRGSYTANPSTTTDCPGQELYTRLGSIRDDLENATSGDTPIGPRESRSVKVTGNGVPSSAEAVALNITAVNATSTGYITVWPKGVSRPHASTLNPEPGSVTVNEIIAKVGDDGFVNVYNRNGNTDIVVDILGYFPAGSDYTPATPRRLFDTRDGGQQ